MSDLFERSDPIVQELYESLLSKLKIIGPYKIESKKTSIHLVSRAAFLGVHPKRRCLEINAVSSNPLDKKLGYKTEQVSKNRYHNRIRIEKVAELDSKLMQDIGNTYKLMS